MGRVEKAAVSEVQYKIKWPLHLKLNMPIKECHKSKWQHQMHATVLVVKFHPSENKDFFMRWSLQKNIYRRPSSISSSIGCPEWVLLHLTVGLLISSPLKEHYYIHQWKLIKYDIFVAADIPPVLPPALLDMGKLFGDASLFIDHYSGFLTSFERCQQIITP